VTEVGWPSGNDPGEVERALRGRARKRKLRLYACALCRRYQGWAEGDELFDRGVETAERYADREVTRAELRDVRRALHEAWELADLGVLRVGTGEERHARALLRCVFSPDPFRPVPALDPAVLAWNGGAVGKVARSIYEGWPSRR
jgi:hypothetical protein